jgi:hypothetical protein
MWRFRNVILAMVALIAIFPAPALAESAAIRTMTHLEAPGSADDASLQMTVVEFDNGNESFLAYLDALTLYNSGEPFEEKNWTMHVELFGAPLSTTASGWYGSSTDAPEPRSVALLLLRYGTYLHIWELSLDADAIDAEAAFQMLLDIAERRFEGSFEGSGDNDLMRQLPTPELLGAGWEIASDEVVPDWQSP